MPAERLAPRQRPSFRTKTSLPQGWRDSSAQTRRKPPGNGRSCETRVKHDLSFYINDLVWLGRQDSNLGSRDQNPLPYRLATPHHACSEAAPAPGEPSDSTGGPASGGAGCRRISIGPFRQWIGTFGTKKLCAEPPTSLLRAGPPPSIYGPLPAKSLVVAECSAAW